MALSYAQYAGNGSTTTFSVPFPYILKAHVKVYIGFNILNGTFTSELVDGTGFSWTSGTQIQCTTAPASGQTLTVIRVTPSSSRLVDWNDGSNLIAADMDTADLQNLYVVQEQQDRNDSGAAAAVAAQTAANTATAAATAATTAANTANATAAAATTAANNATAAANASTAASTAAANTANTASANASAAVSTANTAATNASTALSTANTAATNASNAVTTANTAASNASTALSTANTAASNASTAQNTANTAASNASTALSTANTAATNASSAVTTANAASASAANAVTTANNAVTTANTANNTANQAAAAVSQAVLFTLVANVAAIPASPANNTYIEVGDSTGIAAFTPLVGLPGGFTGDAGLTVRLRYTTAGSTWNYLSYFANNPETRYLNLASAASQAEAEAGSNNTKYTTPLRVAQAIAQLSPPPVYASQAEAEAGIISNKVMSPLRVSQAIAVLATSGATGGGTDKVFVQNDQVVTTNYTIPSGKNASSVGPLSIDAGATVTISANSTWVIL